MFLKLFDQAVFSPLIYQLRNSTIQSHCHHRRFTKDTKQSLDNKLHHKYFLSLPNSKDNEKCHDRKRKIHRCHSSTTSNSLEQFEFLQSFLSLIVIFCQICFEKLENKFRQKTNSGLKIEKKKLQSPRVSLRDQSRLEKKNKQWKACYEAIC